MNDTTFTLIPHTSTYSDYKRARLSEVDTTAGEIVHRWPSGAVNVRFPGIDGFPAFEMITAQGNLTANKVEKAA